MHPHERHPDDISFSACRKCVHVNIGTTTIHLSPGDFIRFVQSANGLLCQMVESGLLSEMQGEAFANLSGVSADLH